jgi:LysW-gamma-L-lysine carboxypeptidase
MTDEEALDLVRGMVRIASPSGHERELAAHFVCVLRSAGFDAHVDDAGNAIGAIGSAAGPQILLLGHLDTVLPLLPVREEGGVLYGRGAVDAKGALAAFAAAASRARDCGSRLIVAGAVEEEVASSRGARALRDRLRPAAVLIGEPSGWSGVTIGYQGTVRLTYAIEAETVHLGHEQDVAVELAARFWERLRLALRRTYRSARTFERAVPRLYGLEGGVERARAEIRVRTPPGFQADAFLRDLRRLAGAGTIEIGELTPAVLVPRAGAAVRSLTAAIRAQGGEPRHTVKTGSSDMNVVAERWRVPMAAYGPGDSRLDHTPHERLDLAEHLRSVAVLSAALETLAASLRTPGAAPARPAAAGRGGSDD